MAYYDDDTEWTVIRTILYSRQSKGNKVSIDRQDRECLADIDQQDWPSPERYSDGKSASRFATEDRDEWPMVIAEIENIDTTNPNRRTALALWESSRGDRDPETWIPFLALCRRKGVLIRVKSDRRTYDLNNPRDWRSLAEDGIDNAWDSEKTSMRVQADMRGNAEGGKPHAKAAFGYRRTYNPVTGKLLAQVIDDIPRYSFLPDGSVLRWTPAEIVRSIYADILKGVSLTDIADRLNANCIPTPRVLAAAEAADAERCERWEGVVWSRQTVRQLVLHEVYNGNRVHSVKRGNAARTKPRIIAKATWEPLVSHEDFIEVGRILRDPVRKTTCSPRARHLLSYLAQCECGADLQVRGPGYKCLRNHTYIGEDGLDHFVTAWIIERLSKPANFAHMGSGRNADQEIAAAHTKIGDLRDELDGWLRDAEDPTEPTVDREIYKRQARRILPQIERLEARIRTGFMPPVLRGLVGPQNAEKFTKLDLSTRRDVIRLVATITVRKATRRGRHAEPVRERVTIEPR